MVRAIITKHNKTTLEVTATTWDKLFEQIDTSDADSIEGEIIDEEDWDERI